MPLPRVAVSFLFGEDERVEGGSDLRLGTKLTIYLSLIIVLMLSGYGYLDILSRRDILIRKLKAEVRSTGRTLEVTLEKKGSTRF